MITIDATVNLRAWVPIDDDYHMLMMMSGKADGATSSAHGVLPAGLVQERRGLHP